MNASRRYFQKLQSALLYIYIMLSTEQLAAGIAVDGKSGTKCTMWSKYYIISLLKETTRSKIRSKF